MIEIENLPGNRVLVFAPHNDDEILGTAGAIQRYGEFGGQAHVAIMTNGDAQIRRPRRLPFFSPNFVNLGYRRQSESRKALGYLGLPPERVHLLGYPDRGLDELWTDYWGYDNLYRSPYTKADHSPYKDNYNPKAAYCGLSVLNDTKEVIREVNPDVIFLPHPNDRHQDHWATNGFATLALLELQNEGYGWFRGVKLMSYLVHGVHFPYPRGEFLLASLTRPKTLEGLDTEWFLFPLSFTERVRKLRAIGKYRSQTQLMRKYLVSFARANELFGVVPELDLSTVPELENPFRLSMDVVLEEERETSFLSYLDPKSKSRLATLKRYPDLRSVSLGRNNGNLEVLIQFYNVCGRNNEIKIIIKSVNRTGEAKDASRSNTFVSKTDNLYVNGVQVDKSSPYRYKRDRKSYSLSVPIEELRCPQKIILSITLGRNGVTFARSANRVIKLDR
ncbi:PIG-L family deacetylase [Candidatus Bipolaricaulota bacterium]|nr:PIG-L family deacetylase [Candidatus Bipolaricaulota bacterium]